MARKHKIIHQITELLAVILLVPFLISLLYKYKFKDFDKNFLILIIILTIIIDGYLFFTWFNNNKIDNEKKEMIHKLIKQISRWASAAKQDNSPLISVLHANYGVGYLYAMQSIFTQKEIEVILGSEEIRKDFEDEIINIQDYATKKAVKECPQYSSIIDFLSELAGES